MKLKHLRSDGVLCLGRWCGSTVIPLLTILTTTPTTSPAVANDGLPTLERNQAPIYAAALRLQGLESCFRQARDPLLDRTFGAAVQGPGLTRAGAAVLRLVQPGRRLAVQIHALTAQTATAHAWQDQLQRQVRRVAAVPTDRAWAEHRQWWQAFWKRSWVRVSGGAEDETGALTRGWHWQRYLIACCGRGAFPVKFNGAIFTIDGSFGPRCQYGDYNADFRAWGGAYWFQNTRHIYWPLAVGVGCRVQAPCTAQHHGLVCLSRREGRLAEGQPRVARRGCRAGAAGRRWAT